MQETASATRAAPPRMAFLDITKGILVVLMVVYHSLNYTNQYHLGFRYLSFLPPSFILITGFLISHVYGVRYRRGDRLLVKRLLVRGAKLLVLFTALNIIAQFVRSPAYGQTIGVVTLFQRWDQIFFLGSERAAVFEVLLPIAYLLLMAPLFLWLAHRHRVLLPAFALCLVAGCTFLERQETLLLNLNLISAGVLGMMAGQFISKPAILGRYVWFAFAAYLAYFPLGLAKGYIYLVQLIGASVALALVCGLSVRLGDTGWWQQRFIRLGQYSLMAYIVQIGILQTLSRFVGRPNPLSFDALSLFLGTLLLMTMIVEATNWARNRSPKAERFYKAVFA
jgi:peptidoglycan/LPS O-acetylase OafA/YrhL